MAHVLSQELPQLIIKNKLIKSSLIITGLAPVFHKELAKMKVGNRANQNSRLIILNYSLLKDAFLVRDI